MEINNFIWFKESPVETGEFINIPLKKWLLIKLRYYVKEHQIRRGRFQFKQYDNGLVCLTCYDKGKEYLVAICTEENFKKLGIEKDYVFGVWWFSQMDYFYYLACREWFEE